MPTVEAERKLVEVVIQMLFADGSLIRPKNPSFQERGHSVHTGHQFVCRLAALAENCDFVGVALLGDIVIALPPVRVNHRPARD